MKVIFLGTGGSMPTKARSLPSVLIKRGAELIMFDCGEGVQRQMLISRAGFNRKMRILVSHMHADHILGLPGLLHSMSFLGRSEKLDVYGPEGIGDFMGSMGRIIPLRSGFPIETHEVAAGTVLEAEEYVIKAAWAKHSIPCLGFALVEKPRPGRFYPSKARGLGIPEGPLWKLLQKGQIVRLGGRIVKPRQVTGPPRPGLKVTYAVDTRPCSEVVELAKGSDLLIHDSTFADEASDKAKEYWHSTAKEAARTALKSRSRMLALFHISAMYRDASILLREAKEIFPNTFLAEDMMVLELKHRES